MNGRSRTSIIETLLVTIILIFFSVAVFSLVASGSDTYKKIIDNKDDLSQARVALSYINVKIRQNDTSNNVYISDEIFSQTNTLIIKHTGILKGMITYIFYDNGVLWECFIQDSIKPDKEMAMKVSAVDSLKLSDSDEGNIIHIEAGYHIGDKAKTLKNNIILRTYNTFDKEPSQ